MDRENEAVKAKMRKKLKELLKEIKAAQAAMDYEKAEKLHIPFYLLRERYYKTLDRKRVRV